VGARVRAAVGAGGPGCWAAAVAALAGALEADAATLWRGAGDRLRPVARYAAGRDAVAALAADPGVPAAAPGRAPAAPAPRRLAAPLVHGAAELGALEVAWLGRASPPPGARPCLEEAAAVLAAALAGRAAEEGLRAVAAASADAVVVVDGEGRVLLWNPAAAELFGRTPEEMIGSPLTRVMPERHRRAHREGLARALAGGPRPELYGRPLEFAGLRADGREFPLELRLGRGTAAGEAVVAGIVRDVTERRASEEAERAVSLMAARLSAGGLDLHAILDAITVSARDALGAARATCYVTDPATGVVTRVHTTETDPRRRAFLEGALGRPPLDLPIWRRSVEAPEPLMLIEDLRAEPALPPALARRLGAGAIMAVRLEHPSVEAPGADTLLGDLFLTFPAPRRFGPQARMLLRGLGGLATLALANARLYARTRDHLRAAEARAGRDGLTGLATHRVLQERLASEVARSRRHGRALSLVVLDVDRFGALNEAHGHEAGDRVLVEVARRLAAAARPEDLLARLGGDEFALVLPECAGEDAWRVADAARRAVAATPVPGVGTVTLSGGVSTVADAGDAEGLLRLAGGALYWAKGQGRGRVVRYSPQEVEVLSDHERVLRLERAQTRTALRVLARAVDAKDPSTRRHSARVAELAARLARALGWPEAEVGRIHEAGLMHDVGKIGIPDHILSAPRRLTGEEYAAITTHAALGARIVADVLSPAQVAWIRGHHERHDGRGYPDGLAGDAIPGGARILAVADAWDVMVSDRPYSPARGVPEALAECRRASGTQFAPPVVAALAGLVASGDLVAPESAVDRVAPFDVAPE